MAEKTHLTGAEGVAGKDANDMTSKEDDKRYANQYKDAFSWSDPAGHSYEQEESRFASMIDAYLRRNDSF